MSAGLTVHVAVVRHGVDLLAGQHLHVFPAGAAVELVGPNQPAAHAVRHLALLAHMLREIRRGLIGYLSKIKRHHNQYLTQCMYCCIMLVVVFFGIHANLD